MACPLAAVTVYPLPPCRVDNGIPLAAALQQHHAWLCEHGFVGPSQRAVAVTWTDWDLKVHGQPASLHRSHCTIKPLQGLACCSCLLPLSEVLALSPQAVQAQRHPDPSSPEPLIWYHSTVS